MWDHAHLLRRTLLLISLLTLSGLHEQQDQQAARWRPALLLTLLLSLFCSAAATASIFTAPTVWQSMYCLTISMTIYHALFVLGYLLYHRRWMLELIRRIAELERATAVCRQPGDLKVFQRIAALICCITMTAIMVWMVVVFSQPNLTHPHYIQPAWLPQIMLTPSWYAAVMVLQAVFSVMTLLLQIMFEMLLVGISDAAKVFTARLGVFCCEYVSDDVGRKSKVSRSDEGSDIDRTNKDKRGANKHGLKIDAFISGNIINGDTNVVSIGDAPHHEVAGGIFSRLRPPITSISDRSSGMCKLQNGSAASTLCIEEPPASLDTQHNLENRLFLLRELYGRVRRLVEDADAFCSFLTLSLHSTVATGLLLGTYVTIIIFTDSSAVFGLGVGFIAFQISIVMRLLIVSCAGSRLIQQGQRLHAQLAAVSWGGHVTARARFALHQLLEQSRSPVTFEGWGLFTVQKGTMLSLFGFVLTYCVILIQMQVR